MFKNAVLNELHPNCWVVSINWGAVHSSWSFCFGWVCEWERLTVALLPSEQQQDSRDTTKITFLRNQCNFIV